MDRFDKIMLSTIVAVLGTGAVAIAYNYGVMKGLKEGYEYGKTDGFWGARRAVADSLRNGIYIDTANGICVYKK